MIAEREMDILSGGVTLVIFTFITLLNEGQFLKVKNLLIQEQIVSFKRRPILKRQDCPWKHTGSQTSIFPLKKCQEKAVHIYLSPECPLGIGPINTHFSSI